MAAITGMPAAAQSPSAGLAGESARRAYSRPIRRRVPAQPQAAAASSAANGTGIVYTCDPNLTAVYAPVCTVLNTTIASLYSATFTNANAAIYVKLGATDLGLSDYAIDTAIYSRLRTALIASEAGANDVTAVTASVPLNGAYSGLEFQYPNALARSLGFSAGFGIPTSGQGFCTAGASGCYDGIITVSNSAPLYFRNGTIGSDQFDFFTVVEHETDEILGTASCAFGCSGDIAPADLFRYHSSGTLSFAAGSNHACSSSSSNNACFSLDGVHMLQEYNNLDNGDDAGDWSYGCTQNFVQNAEICAGVGNVDISPTAEILVLDVIGYTLNSAAPGSVTNVTSTAANGTYGVGALIAIQVTFSEAVTVSGIPQLALNSGGVAAYSSGSGSSTLNFAYTVAAGQSSSHLDYASSAALTLNGGTIQGSGGGAVSLTLPAPGAAGSLSANKSLAIASAAAITIQTVPAGLQFSVDGGAAQTAPQTVSLAQGQHTVAVATSQTPGAGILDQFANWSDGGAATHAITVGTGAAAYTATFTTEYQLTWSASPAAGGSVTPASGTYFVAGTVVSVTAKPNTGYAFSSWTGAVASPSSAASTVTMTAPLAVTANFTVLSTTSGLAFFPVTPCRVADTRSGSGPFGGPSMTAGSTRNFTIPQSTCGIPSGAQAYSLNVTAVPPAPLTYLSIWPAGQPQPVVSTLNSFDGQVVANAAIVPAGSGGAISVFVSNATDVILDIDGYFAPPASGGLAFYALTPCRVVDTRNAAGTFGGPQMSAGQTRGFPVGASACGVPAAAQAYSLNVTVVPPGPLIYLSTWPAGLPQPLVSTLNSFNGRVVANAAMVPAGTAANGPIDVFVSNASDVIVDINGYFGPPGGAGALYFYNVTPCRIADTRAGSGFPSGFGGPSLAANSTRTFAVQSSGCGLPATAQAYSFNVTVVPPGPLTYLSAWPAGEAQPVVSTLNSFGGTVVANAAIVTAGVAPAGAIDIFVSNATDFILDVNGYFAQ